MHQGRYQGSAPRDISSPAWTFKAEDAIISSAVCVGGSVYFGSDDRYLYALDATSGDLRWKFASEGKIRSTPAVADGSVVFGSYDGFVYSLSTDSGKLQWKFQTGGERHFEAKGLHGAKPSTQTIPDVWDCYASSPSVVGGTVFIGSGDGYLYALCAKSGELKWKFKTGDVVHGSPAVWEGKVYVGSWDTYMYALDAKSGAEIWRFKTGEDKENHNRTGIQSSPMIYNGTVYFGCRDFDFYALDASTGELKWKSNLTWVNATPALWDGKVYYGSSIPPFLSGRDAATGEQVLKMPMPMMVFSSAAIADGVAYVGCFQGSLFAVDLKEGKVISEFRSPAAIANRGTLFNEDGSWNTKNIFRNDSFEEMYHGMNVFHEAGAILASPCISNGSIYVGAGDGSFFCFR